MCDEPLAAAARAAERRSGAANVEIPGRLLACGTPDALGAREKLPPIAEELGAREKADPAGTVSTADAATDRPLDADVTGPPELPARVNPPAPPSAAASSAADDGAQPLPAKQFHRL